MKHLFSSFLVSFALLGGQVVAASAPIDQAATAIAEGSVDQAREVLTDLLKTEPNNVEALLKLGGVELGAGNYPQAIDLLKKAASLDAATPRPFIGLALAYVHTGRGALAHAAIQEAVKRDPTKAETLKPLLERLEERSAPSGH
ncbi:MAG: tetratricopeptide repeat protein [Gammaproteobacteria bacterium]|nr:tetratricopeptide repeat protein [Gammaproteobacteria bacterium]MCP5136128.1 tetratricopeptide repeat protein [Gammaproteobacteria bacterium]